MDTASYNPSRFIFTFATIDLKATGKDGFFKITQMTQTFSSIPSLNGDVTFVQSNDQRVKVELTLLSCDVTQINALRLIHEAARTAKNGSGVAPLIVQNLDTGEIWTMPEAVLTKHADLEVKQEPGERVWEFEATSCK